jgi:hypothetical protein
MPAVRGAAKGFLTIGYKQPRSPRESLGGDREDLETTAE